MDDIATQSLKLALKQVELQPKLPKLKLANNILHFGDGFNDMYVKSYHKLQAIDVVDLIVNIALTELQITEFQSRIWWDLSLKAGAVENTKSTQESISGAKWWIDSGSKTQAFYEHLADGITTKRIKDQLPQIKDSDIIEVMLDAFALCNLVQIDQSIGRGESKYLVEQFYDVMESRSLANYCFGWESMVRENSESAKRKASLRYRKDPKQLDKVNVKECWDLWQADPRRYKNKTTFANDMLGKFESLTSEKVITDWCREWGRQI
ncbi:hypothetical protein ICN49_02420 [Polynucleobacter sp. MWH-Mekk-B1]|uniref:hypothetical protein n=1 Tax=Polynucleobacter finlandensis TaxID=1855894 RepID=UPI001C0D5EAB|nr:hypothetical protein [Polynucleobacter finlandensis]MBU3543767.1 hypothetical protein [Polynucleobacter finlandensis]